MAAENPPKLKSLGGSNFKVTPQDRFDHLLAFNEQLREEVSDSIIRANRRHQGSTTFSSVDGLPHIIIEEIDYPGDTASHPFGKWAYLLHAQKNIFLAELVSEQIIITAGWRWRDFPNPNDSAALRDPDGAHWQSVMGLGARPPVPITSLAPGEDPTVLKVFLSPYQLSEQAMTMLLGGGPPLVNSRPMSTAFVKPIWSHPKPAYVALPDPLSWAVETKLQFYEPRLNAYQEKAMSEKVQAEHAIAGVIAAWIANGDPADVEDELARKPDDYLKAFENEIRPIRRRVEESAAYLCSCIDSPEHHVVEAALNDAHKDVPLHRSFCIQHWAAVVERLQECAPGAEFLNTLVDDARRAPARFILTEFSALDFAFFEGHRWASLGAMGLLGELAPTWVAKQVTLKVPELTIEAKAKLAFERLGVKLDSNNRKRTYEFLIQTQPTKVPPKYQKKIKQMAVLFDQSALPAQMAAEAEKSVKDAAEESAGKILKSVRYPVQAVLEITNLALAIGSFKQDKEWKVRSTASLVGASVDLTGFVMEVSLIRQLSIGARATIQKRIAVLAIMSGVLDCFEHSARFMDGGAQRDYGRAVGHGIAALGAGAIAVGGVMSLVAIGAGTGSTLGPLGAIIGAIGALVMVAGSLIASYLRLNAYEQFARHSFLGKEAGAVSTVDFPWAVHFLPAKDPVRQLEVLYGLMSNFRMTLKGDSNPVMGPATGQPLGFVEIFPGDIDPAATLEVEITHVYKVSTGVFSTREDKQLARLRFKFDQIPEQPPAEDQTQVPFMSQIEVERHETMGVKRIAIPIQPAFVKADPAQPMIPYKDYAHRFSALRAEYRVRIVDVAKIGSRTLSVPLSKRVKLDVMAAEGAASIDDSVFD